MIRDGESMSIPPIPPPLDSLGARPFSFYPAILNIEHNEWLFRKATWSEMLVYNVKSKEEIWIPRRFIGELSRIEDPVVIVGLIKELEYRNGVVMPYQRRIIEMPLAVNDRPAAASAPRPAAPAPVVGIKLEPGPEARIGKLIFGALLVGVMATLGVIMATREGVLRPTTSYSNTDSAFLDLTPRDDYYSIIAKLGPPEQDHTIQKGGELEFRSLWYPQRAYYVILGSQRDNLRYIGAMDKEWKVVHAVELPGGTSTAPLLRGLARF
jgi:hypothetical protein